MQTPVILIVEDEEVTRLNLVSLFEGEGYDVVEAVNGEEMNQKLAEHKVNLIVMDINLPGKNGLILARELRQKENVGLIFLTGRDSEVDRILGLEIGADDYLTKPFELAELEARLAALLRRQGRQRTGQLSLGDLSLDVQGEVRWRSEPLALSKRETAALRELLSSANKTLSKDRLHRAVFNDEDAGLDAVEVLVHRLRKKLDQHTQSTVCITTFRGLGYMLTLAKP